MHTPHRTGANSLLMKVKIKEYFLFSKWILYFKHALVFCAQRSCIYYEFHVMLANADQGSPAVSLVSGHNLKHRRQFYIISLRFSDVSVLFFCYCHHIQSPHEKLPHPVNPADVRADLREDGGLLWDVAALTRTKTHHPVGFPGTISCLAVQRSTRVSLQPSESTSAANVTAFSQTGPE